MTFLTKFITLALLKRLIKGVVGKAFINSLFDEVLKLAKKSETTLDDASVEVVRELALIIIDEV